MTRKLSQDELNLWAAFVKVAVPLNQPVTQASSPKLSPEFGYPHYAEVNRHGTLDLHGLTLQQAHKAVTEFIAENRNRWLTVITGISGEIKREFGFWCENQSSVRRVESLNDGAYRLHLKTHKKSR